MTYRYDQASDTWITKGRASILGTGGLGAPTAVIDFTAQALATTFDGTKSTQKGGTITAYAWNFGDGATSTAAKPSHTYAAAGDYVVTLTVTGSSTLQATATSTISVSTTTKPVPTADFSFVANNAADPLRVNFDASASSVPSGSIVKYDWDFQQSLYSSTSPLAPGYYYTAAGTYTVRLTVTTDQGATASVSKAVAVVGANVPPTAKITSLTVGSDAKTVTAVGAATDSDGYVASITWDWGDGSAKTTTTGTKAAPPSASASHVYSPGTYTVTLTATDDRGASTAVTGAVTVAAPPVATGGTGDSGVNQTGKAGQQQTPTGAVQYQSLSGSTTLAKVKSAGTTAVSFAAGTYSFSDFLGGVDGGTSSSGNTGSGLQFNRGCKGVFGAGSASTVFSMVANSSSRAGSVPVQGSGSTNQLQYVDIDSVPDGFVMDGVKIAGTAQGHMYNGLRIHNPGNSTFQNSTITGMPGNNSSPPGETFMMNIFAQAAGKKMTIKNMTFDGAQGGTRVAAALLGTNNTAGQIDIVDCLFQNQQYSSTVTIWELQKGGVINIIRPVTKLASRRNIGNEAQAGVINIYDPLFCDPASGSDDIRSTWTSNFNEGTINVYFTTQAKWDAFLAGRTVKKLTTICSVKQAYGGSAGGAYTGTKDIRNYCHLFIGGVEVDKTNRWTFTGQPVN
jgi:PKD repeat protein